MVVLRIGAYLERKSLIFQVISALVSQKHIVTPAYLENVVKKLKEGVAIPDPDLYVDDFICFSFPKLCLKVNELLLHIYGNI